MGLQSEGLGAFGNGNHICHANRKECNVKRQNFARFSSFPLGFWRIARFDAVLGGMGHMT